MISLEQIREQGLVLCRPDGSEAVLVTLTAQYPPVVFGTRDERLEFWRRKFDEIASELTDSGLELLDDTISWSTPSVRAFLSVSHFEDLISWLLLRGFRVDATLDKTSVELQDQTRGLSETDLEAKFMKENWSLALGEFNNRHWGKAMRIRNDEYEYKSATGCSRLEVLRALDAQSRVLSHSVSSHYLNPGVVVGCIIVLVLLVYLLATAPMQ